MSTKNKVRVRARNHSWLWFVGLYLSSLTVIALFEFAGHGLVKLLT